MPLRLETSAMVNAELINGGFGSLADIAAAPARVS